jgi:hypothetical protein
MARDTSTGTKYEKQVEQLLNEGNYHYQSQVIIGKKRNGGNHRVDLIIDKTLISLKHQEVKGTAEEKVPFEFMKLQQAVNDYHYDNAVIVLSGDSGWTWKNYYLSQEFKTQMNVIYPDVSIMSHEQFLKIYDI